MEVRLELAVALKMSVCAWADPARASIAPSAIVPPSGKKLFRFVMVMLL